jgi:hypothetical protein
MRLQLSPETTLSFKIKRKEGQQERCEESSGSDIQYVVQLWYNISFSGLDWLSTTYLDQLPGFKFAGGPDGGGVAIFVFLVQMLCPICNVHAVSIQGFSALSWASLRAVFFSTTLHESPLTTVYSA